MQFLGLRQKYRALCMGVIERWDVFKQAFHQVFTRELVNPTISVVGIGTHYGATILQHDFLEDLLARHCHHSPVVMKTWSLIERSGIKHLCSVLPLDDPIWHQQALPTIADTDALFKRHALPLVASAARYAISEWGGSVEAITHVVAVTCTNTANPGFDITLCSTLGLPPTVHRTLLHGLGCAGGIAALRTAYYLVLGAAFQGQPARALVVSCDLPTIFARAELHRINLDKEVGFGLSRFSDGASAMMVTNWLDTKVAERAAIWDLLGFRSVIIDESEGYSELNIGPHGYKPTISAFIPKLVSSELFPNFTALVNSIPCLCSDPYSNLPDCYNWAVDFPSCSSLSFAQRALDLKRHNTVDSYTVYKSRGSTISSTVLNILDHMRSQSYVNEGGSRRRGKVIALAIGPGVIMEMAVLRKVTRDNLHYSALWCE
ncbi:thiolase-like protein [Aspergillus alliaceus]|uniref:Thiolase-like protein n=1 Tax=Petromyces alliaceus TaxID=209559 RepID=A0A5N7CIJ5_PETAA|nr:thiolase-like protein [Aspergillus alliaceus]